VTRGVGGEDIHHSRIGGRHVQTGPCSYNLNRKNAFKTDFVKFDQQLFNKILSVTFECATVSWNCKTITYGSKYMCEYI
jgi:hypothetical protein